MIRAKSKGRRIILDERKEVEKILSSPTKNIDYRKIFMIAKYYYEKGLSKKQVEEKILEYCNRSEVFNIYFFQDMIERILRKSKDVYLKKPNQNISITKKEIDKLKILPHKVYRIALYMLFTSKFEKFQTLSKVGLVKKKSFKTYFNYGIKTVLYSLEYMKNDKEGHSRYSQKEMIGISKKIVKAGIAEPMFSGDRDFWEILIADFESKDVEFVIESEIDFEKQIKYYCIKCGKQCEKSKRHDFCKKCYSLEREKKEKERLRKLYLDSRK